MAKNNDLTGTPNFVERMLADAQAFSDQSNHGGPPGPVTSQEAVSGSDVSADEIVLNERELEGVRAAVEALKGMRRREATGKPHFIRPHW